MIDIATIIQILVPIIEYYTQIIVNTRIESCIPIEYLNSWIYEFFYNCKNFIGGHRSN